MENNKSKNMAVGLGNTGYNNIENCIMRGTLTDTKFYAIDSQTAHVNIDTINQMTYIPIIADEKSGSGRNRERGKALYEFHEANGAFDALYEECKNSKSPVIVISSAAGGTGSGSLVPFCKAMIDRDIQVIPIIVCPNDDDPMAYQMNTEDLLIELDEAGITTYSIFKNIKNDAEYTVINNDIAEQIEIIFGKKYNKTTLDSIDDSDLDVVLSTPGRFMTISAKANDISSLKKELTRKMMVGFQPAFTPEEAEKCTFVTAYSLESTFADADFKEVFGDIDNRIKNVYDNYRNIVVTTSPDAIATVIIAGLPGPHIKQTNTEYLESNGIGYGMKKNNRPSFIQKRKASTTKGTGEAASKFNWK